MIKIMKCKVCGCDFPPVHEKHYVARDNEKVGLTAAFQSNGESTLYDAFDCPMCGCQVIAQERKRDFVHFDMDEQVDMEGIFDDEQSK